MSDEGKDEVLNTISDEGLVLKMGTVAANIVSKVSGFISNNDSDIRSDLGNDKELSILFEEKQCKPKIREDGIMNLEDETLMRSRLVAFRKLCKSENKETTKSSSKERLKRIKTNMLRSKAGHFKGRSSVSRCTLKWEMISDFASFRNVNRKINFQMNLRKMIKSTATEQVIDDYDKVS